MLLTEIGIGDVTSTHRIVSGSACGRDSRDCGDRRSSVVVDVFVIIVVVIYLANVIFLVHG